MLMKKTVGLLLPRILCLIENSCIEVSSLIVSRGRNLSLLPKSLDYSLTMHSTAASVRTTKSKVTVGHAPTFRSYKRAEKRKEVSL